MVTIGCPGKGGRQARTASGHMECHGGTWHQPVPVNCDREEFVEPCSPREPFLNGNLYRYNQGNILVFQCREQFKLLGPRVAMCPGYVHPEQDKMRHAFPVVDASFRVPRCEPMEVKDVRPFSRPKRMEWGQEAPGDNNGGRVCSLPLDILVALRSDIAHVSQGESVNFFCRSPSMVVGGITCVDGKWVGDETECIHLDDIETEPTREVERRGCEDVLVEPEHGTYYIFNNPLFAHLPLMVYFQCVSGYTLRQSPVMTCDSIKQDPSRIPMCYPDPDPQSARLTKETNQDPHGQVACAAPPDYIPNGFLVLQDKGENAMVTCRHGAVLDEPGSPSVALLHCENGRWSRSWPRCRMENQRRGDTLSYDPFGREIQQLTGIKADEQHRRLRQQFLEHSRQLQEFRQRQMLLAQQQGLPSRYVPRGELPMLSGLTPEVRRHLESTYGDVYQEAEPLLDIYSPGGGRSRVRRKNHPAPGDDDPVEEVIIPEMLKHLEKDIKEQRLTQLDIDMLRFMDDALRLKFIEDHRKRNVKTKADPVQSQMFLTKVLSKKTTESSADSTENEVELGKKSLEAATPPLFELMPEPEALTSKADLLLGRPPLENTLPTNDLTEPLDAGRSNETDLADGLGQLKDSEANATAPEEAPEDDLADEVDEDSEEAAAPAKDKKKKNAFDDSCALMGHTAPEVDNGFILSYDMDDDGLKLKVKYRCLDGFKFEYESASHMLCRRGKWIGEKPQCIPDDGAEESRDAD